MSTKSNLASKPSAFSIGWSLIVVTGIFGLVIVLRSEPGRAVASVVCLALVMQSWFTQRRYVKSRERLVLVALALSLPALASVWLGLNVLRFYSYDPVSDISVYSTVVRLQAIIEGFAYVPSGNFHFTVSPPTLLTLSTCSQGLNRLIFCM